jgi:hypothetical protein
VIILISEKINFRTKEIARDRETLNNDKRANQTRSHSNPKYVYTKNSCKIGKKLTNQK